MAEECKIRSGSNFRSGGDSAVGRRMPEMVATPQIRSSRLRNWQKNARSYYPEVVTGDSETGDSAIGRRMPDKKWWGLRNWQKNAR